MIYLATVSSEYPYLPNPLIVYHSQTKLSGCVYDKLCLGEIANPYLLFDEYKCPLWYLAFTRKQSDERVARGTLQYNTV